MTQRRLRFAVCIIALSLGALSLVVASPARAEAGLQLNPQKYEDTLTGSAVRNGFIDVSNPSDTSVSLVTNVQGFRQVDLDGNLQFFDDAKLRDGIKVGLDQFDLGPRESIRVSFSVDPTKLPQGGVYATIFFRTVPPAVSSDTSFISESANVGTLLILQNGTAGQHLGQISHFDLPWLAWGSKISGQVEYRNTNRDVAAIAFYPSLMDRVGPWGHGDKWTGPFIMPSSSRRFSFERTGAYFGLVPVTLTDQASGKSTTAWVLAFTGWCRWLLVLILFALMLMVFAKARLGLLWRKSGSLVRWPKWWRRRKQPSTRSLDGLSRKSQ